MKLIVCDNYSEVSKTAADIVTEQINNNPRSILGLATGSTPIGMYKELAEREIDFSKVQSFNLDEYYPISPDNSQCYRHFMNKKFFSKINIDIKNTYILDGQCEDTDKECKDFESLIAEKGGIDLQILGIGQNGHIGFNEPDDSLNSLTHLANLTQDTIDANSRFFDSPDDVPKQALTMGIGSILKARKIILLACGTNKHNAVKALLSGRITTDIPASMLNVHNDVTLICDKQAYSNDRLGVDIGGTEIKFGVLDSNNKLVFKDSISTEKTDLNKFIDDVISKAKDIMEKYAIVSIGVGVPGIVINDIVNTDNTPMKNTNLKAILEENLGLPVNISNDANCAALAEMTARTEVKNLVMITLGTGIGGGIIADGKIYDGRGGAGEIGHMSIDMNGKACPCGQRGCWELYASTTALTKMAEDNAISNPVSLLNELYTEHGKMNGKIFFDAVEHGCKTADAVLSEYLRYLSVGIKTLCKILEPEVVVLAGGIINSGELFLDKLKAMLGNSTPIELSKLKNDAGVIGAALLQKI